MFNDIQQKGNNDISKKTMQYLIDDVLIGHFNYLEPGINNNSESMKSNKYKITPKGFTAIHKLFHETHESKVGFCAMWFNNAVNSTWKDAIKPAIIDAGYVPKRIDEEHFNKDINAKIIMLINKSKFIVADFTGNRGGVYFEAGYAHGLKIPVIYTCEQQEFDDNRPHFDVEHYNFIIWNKGKLEEFKNNLENRIVNTIYNN